MELFKLNNFNIDTSKYNHLLHGTIVNDFEERFREYVGADYCVALNSCTSAIFLVYDYMFKNYGFISPRIPAIIPPVVYNAIYHAMCINGFDKDTIVLTDNTLWIGDYYRINSGMFLVNNICIGDPMYDIIDTAHAITKIHPLFTNGYYIYMYSFYPTKPIGGADGGVVATNNYDLYCHLKSISMNGYDREHNCFSQCGFGWKYYMSSAQAECAQKAFEAYLNNRDRLKDIRYFYNHNLGLENTSEHLYTVNVKNRDKLCDVLRKNNIKCGIHYTSLIDIVNNSCNNIKEVFEKHTTFIGDYDNVKKYSDTTISIPYHVDLSTKDLKKVVENVKRYQVN